MSGRPAPVTRWWWVRHAPVNSGGRIYGAADVDADCSDPSLFRGLAARLPEPAIWVTSHLRRTHQTAEAIFEQRGDGAARPSLQQDPELGEQSFGDWQGLTYAECEESRGKGMETFWLAPAEETPPNGESFAALVERVSAAIRRLTEQHRGADIVAVTHGGTIRAALSLALKLPPAQVLAFSIDNCSLTRIDHIPSEHEPGGEAWRVAGVNVRPEIGIRERLGFVLRRRGLRPRARVPG